MARNLPKNKNGGTRQKVTVSLKSEGLSFCVVCFFSLDLQFVALQCTTRRDVAQLLSVSSNHSYR